MIKLFKKSLVGLMILIAFSANAFSKNTSTDIYIKNSTDLTLLWVFKNMNCMNSDGGGDQSIDKTQYHQQPPTQIIHFIASAKITSTSGCGNMVVQDAAHRFHLYLQIRSAPYIYINLKYILGSDNEFKIDEVISTVSNLTYSVSTSYSPYGLLYTIYRKA